MVRPLLLAVTLISLAATTAAHADVGTESLPEERSSPASAPGPATSESATVGAGASKPPAIDPSSELDAALASARAKKLSESAAWLRLGHYRPTVAGWKSQADGVSFFVAANGKNDPEEELEATLRAFFDPVVEKTQHAQCRFPARLEFLLREVPLDPATLPHPQCPELSEFVARLAARAVTFTFSSYYLGNPSSAFGHTLLRLDKDERLPDGKQKELLDWGVNYAGEIDTRNPVLYAAKGILGGFRGSFSTVPYFYKVREYNDFEARDLFEYRLALTDDELHRLVLHLWELGQTYFDYFYVDENCSYQLLAALEAAAPRLQLLDGLKPYVVPADAVKALFRNPGLVVSAKWRPSLRSVFEARMRGLDPASITSIRALESDPAATPDGFDAATPERQARLLDAAVDLFDLDHARELLGAPDSEPAKVRHALLVRRSRIHVASEELAPEYPLGQAPERGHEILRLGVLGGASLNGRGGFAELRFRPALHDLLDRADGYPRTTVMELLPITLRYEAKRSELLIEDAQLLRIANLAPVTGLWPSAAWNFQLGAVTLRDGGCTRDSRCLVGETETGVGISAEALHDKLLVFAFAEGQVAAGPQLRGAFGSPVRPSVGPSIGARWHVCPGFSTALSAIGWLHFEDAPRPSWAAQWESRFHTSERLSLDLIVRRTGTGFEASAGALAYF